MEAEASKFKSKLPGLVVMPSFVSYADKLAMPDNNLILPPKEIDSLNCLE